MKIEQYLNDKQMTLTDLSKKLNCSISYLCKIKQNQIRPNEDIKNQLLKLGIDELPLSTDQIKNHKNERIRQLLKENKELKLKIIYLENQIINNIDIALERAIHQTKTHYKAHKTPYQNRK